MLNNKSPLLSGTKWLQLHFAGLSTEFSCTSCTSKATDRKFNYDFCFQKMLAAELR